MKSNNVKSISEKAKYEPEGISHKFDNIEWWNVSLEYGYRTNDVEPLSFILSLHSTVTFINETGRTEIEICFHSPISDRGEWRQNRVRISNERMLEYE